MNVKPIPILIALVAFWLVVHNANEAAGTTAPLTCHFRSITCEAMDVPPFVHHPDVPERDQLAVQNPEQPAGVLDTTRVAYDLGITAERLARPWPGYLMDRPSDDGWLAAVA